MMFPFSRHARAAVCLRGLCLIAAMAFFNGLAISAGPPVGPDGKSVLVLRNGRIISGRVSQGSGGFIVKKINGSVLVPFKYVRLRASDLRDAYRRLRESVKVPSATAHIALANWCLTQQMYDETLAELKAALKIEPDRAEARNMLRRLEELLNPRGAQHLVADAVAQKTGDGFALPETSSLGSLSRETARQFVTKVQPLIMNNCAIGGCHSSRVQNAFRLSRVRAGAGNSRIRTERNLAAILRYIDAGDPDGSRLLTVPRGNHGRAGRAIFSGRRSADQFGLLKSWVRAAAGEKASTLRRRSTNFVNKQPALPPADLLPRSIPETGPQRSAAADDPLLKAVLREERPDAFDPEEFNLQAVNSTGQR
jgi:hypothetical protein